MVSLHQVTKFGFSKIRIIVFESKAGIKQLLRKYGITNYYGDEYITFFDSQSLSTSLEVPENN